MVEKLRLNAIHYRWTDTTGKRAHLIVCNLQNYTQCLQEVNTITLLDKEQRARIANISIIAK